MIENEDYYTQETVEQLVPDMKDFYRWMFGQGCPIIDGKLCYYCWDVDRYLRLKGMSNESSDTRHRG